jgi:hypothetical protein
MTMPSILIPRSCRAALLIAAALHMFGAMAAAQVRNPPPKAASPIERLSPDTLRIGNVVVDTTKKQVTVKGVVNEVTTLEFVANTKGGYKAYESALELDTNAINFNVAMILIGLDHTHATVPKMHLDPTPAGGDPVDIWVEWDENGKPRRVRAEQLVYNLQTKQTLAEGPWVYTGSVFSNENNAYLADIDGTLIGFVHTPSPIIESPRPIGRNEYGNNVINPALNLKAGTMVTVIVRAN